MKRSTFLASIAGLFSFLGLKKRPEKGVQIMYDLSGNGRHMKSVVTRGAHYGDVVHGWTNTRYKNEVSIIKAGDSDKMSVFYIEDGMFKHEIFNQKTGERTLVFEQPSNNLRA